DVLRVADCTRHRPRYRYVLRSGCADRDKQVRFQQLWPGAPEHPVSMCTCLYRKAHPAYPQSSHGRFLASAKPDSVAAGVEFAFVLSLARPAAPHGSLALPVFALVVPATELLVVGRAQRLWLLPHPSARSASALACSARRLSCSACSRSRTSRSASTLA